MGLTRYGDRLTSSAVVAIATILLGANLTIINAQQQQSLTSQPSPATPVTQNVTATSLFQSTEDSIRLNVPEGWVIQDINNTGFTLAAEVMEGYGILAQLCPQEQEQQRLVLTNVGGRNNTYTGSCQHAQEEVIHIIRYPNLGARIGISFEDDIFTTIINNDTIPNAILDYHLQKLQEVGYRDIQILNSTDTTVNVDNSTSIDGNNRNNNTLTAAIPAMLVEMTYSTNSAPSEIRRGFFILTATAATPRNLGMVTGYSLFYEGNSTTTSVVETGTTAATTPYASLAAPTPLPAPVIQVFDSFGLIAAVVPTEPLTVEISSDDIREVVPATFEFEAVVTGGIEPYTTSWDFDDDGSSGEEERGDDVVIEHTFEEAGTYSVGLTVTDSIGQSASDSIEITVEEAPEEVDELEEEEVEPSLAEEIVEEVIVEEEEEEPPILDEGAAAGTNATEGIEGAATTAGTEEEVDEQEVEEEQQPEVEEEQEEVEIEDNNLGSEGLIDLEEIINDYIDDLFDRLR